MCIDDTVRNKYLMWNGDTFICTYIQGSFQINRKQTHNFSWSDSLANWKITIQILVTELHLASAVTWVIYVLKIKLQGTTAIKYLSNTNCVRTIKPINCSEALFLQTWNSIRKQSIVNHVFWVPPSSRMHLC